jgi:hypothetical protein
VFLEKHYNDLIKSLSGLKGLNILHIIRKIDSYVTKVVKDSNGFNGYINPKIYDMIIQFPQFFLFKMSDWIGGSSLSGNLMNVNIVAGSSIPIAEKDNSKIVPLTSTKIFEWVKSKISSNPQIDINNIQSARGHGFISPSKLKMKYNPSD